MSPVEYRDGDNPFNNESPKVTGLSPKEGPPGTKITIRGENLGTSQNDLIGLTICGIDCLMYAEWKSPSKIVARTGGCVGRGDVIVTTKSGGKGSSTVQFRGFFEHIGPTKESAVWIDESLMISSSFGRNRSTSPSQLHPDDPLGISDESTVARFPEEELHDLFPDGSGNLLSENFVPAWYLLENHHGTSFEDLKAGLVCLRRKVVQRHDGPASFLKSNVTAIVECLDVLGALQTSLKKDKQELGPDLTDKLETAVKKSKEEADAIFEGVLSRKDRADATRNALSVLQRYRFLFNLPASIEKNIQRGDYDVVINDYARARSLFHDTEVKVFQKVYREVEQRVDSLREMLREKLKHLPSTMEEQKKLIRYLVNLDEPSDPAWDCLTYIHRWIMDSMNNCKEEHIRLANEREINKDIDTVGTPQVVLFVEAITKLFSERIPDLWKLGQAYLSGDVHMREASEKQEKESNTKQLVYKKMVTDLVTLLCKMLRAALLPPTSQSFSIHLRQSLDAWPSNQTGECLGAWLPLCLRLIRQCYSSMLKLDLPQDVIASMKELLFDLRFYTVKCLFSSGAEDLRNLHISEAWVVEMDDVKGGTTQLPLLFENRVLEINQLVHETILHCGPHETDVFAQHNVQGTIKQLTVNLLHAVSFALDKLAFPNEREAATENNQTTNASTDLSLIITSSSQCPPTQDQKLLIVLSNSNYIINSVIPRLQESFQKYGYADVENVTRIAQAKFRELENKLFSAYIERKCDPVVGAIEPAMYVGRFDWVTCPKPGDVSPYIKEAIMHMVEIHAEVFSVSPPFVGKIMARVVNAVAEELARLYECVVRFTSHGNTQATLDLRAIEEAVGGFKSATASKHFMVCRSRLEPLGDAKEKEHVEDLLQKFRNKMRLQLLSFKEDIICV